MVNSPTSLTSSGLRDWFIQRVTAIILGLYVLFLLIYFLAHPGLQFTTWHDLFSHPAMRIFSFLAILSTVAHAWVGIWTVLTDYVKCICIRLVVQVIVILALLSFLAWGIQILWQI